jgi:hypothetical protein
MFRRLAIWMTLGCYGSIALAGQGLHALVCEHGEEHRQVTADPRTVSEKGTVPFFSPRPSAADGAREKLGQSPTVLSRNAMEADDGDACHHDADSCAICQHHSLGQVFVAAAPVEILLDVCEHLSPPAPQPVHCAALVSAAQPRAPPVV